MRSDGNSSTMVARRRPPPAGDLIRSAAPANGSGAAPTMERGTGRCERDAVSPQETQWRPAR
eukprot:6251327-Alexandrium_andersonii.AAC.1